MFVWRRINTDDEYDDEDDSIGTCLSRGGMRRVGDTHLGWQEMFVTESEEVEYLDRVIPDLTLPMIQRIFDDCMSGKMRIIPTLRRILAARIDEALQSLRATSDMSGVGVLRLQRPVWPPKVHAVSS